MTGVLWFFRFWSGYLTISFYRRLVRSLVHPKKAKKPDQTGPQSINKNIPVNKSSIKAGVDPNENDVRIVDQAYLTRDFKAKSKAAQDLIDNIVTQFCLNPE